MTTSRIPRNSKCPCGSGKKYKHCCSRKNRASDPGIPSRERIGSDGVSLTASSPKTAAAAVTRVRVNYSIRYHNCEAEVSYSYPADTPVVMVGGTVLAARFLAAGDQFFIEDGAIAVVSEVSEPVEWEPFVAERSRSGETNPRVLGTVRYTGLFQVIAFQVAGGDWIETTPEHCFWSVESQSWQPISNFKVGDKMASGDGSPARIESITAPYAKQCELRNIEVEETHSFRVGDSPGGVWTHNGLEAGCRVPKAATPKGKSQAGSTAAYSEKFDQVFGKAASDGVADGSVTFKRWQRGEAIDKPLPDGTAPSWETVQSRYWKNRYQAAKNSGEFSPSQLAEMRRGNAPMDYNPRTGNWESRELHHVDPQRHTTDNSPLNLRELTPDWHGEVDPFRRVPGITVKRGIR